MVLLWYLLVLFLIRVPCHQPSLNTMSFLHVPVYLFFQICCYDLGMKGPPRPICWKFGLQCSNGQRQSFGFWGLWPHLWIDPLIIHNPMGYCEETELRRRNLVEGVAHGWCALGGYLLSLSLSPFLCLPLSPTFLPSIMRSLGMLSHLFPMIMFCPHHSTGN